MSYVKRIDEDDEVIIFSSKSQAKYARNQYHHYLRSNIEHAGRR